MRVSLWLCGVMAGACLVPALSAQDAVKVDPKHYSVVTENDQATPDESKGIERVRQPYLFDV